MKKVSFNEKYKISVFHSLFFTMFRNYGVVIVSFALFTGIIFLRLYSKAAIETGEKQLIKQATAISKRVGQFIADNDFNTYPSFLEVLEELETSDVWIFSNPDLPMDAKYTNISLSEEKQLELKPLIEEVFSGKVSSFSLYSKTYGANYIFAAAPIKKNSGEVIGAVLVNQIAAAQNLVVRRSFTLIMIAALIGILISLIIAFLLTRQLSKPISNMRHTALRLADEDYSAKTKVTESGELGELAGAIDVLSEKLYRAAEERANLEQMRRDFFANISHELRTPITVVRAYTETLLDGIVSDEETQFQYYDRILFECKSMQRLVGDLLSLSKMQNPDFIIEKEPINIIQVIEDVLSGAETIAKEKKIDIAFHHSDHILLMFGDYDRIRQMLMVILDNAVKFSEENGEVSISVTEEDGLPFLQKDASPFPENISLGKEIYRIKNKKLVISISDKGSGISEEELPFIFDKFYKSKLRQNAKGSGLGLSIARQIALKHSGSVTVQSSLGEGTTFIFEFAEIFEA